MKTILFLPLTFVLVLNTGLTLGQPVTAKNKVTTFVTYAYEQGDDPIPVAVPNETFNTPELKTELEAPALLEPQQFSSETRLQQHHHQQHQQHVIHADLARDLQPPREVSLIDLPLRAGPIPIPVQQQQPFPPSPLDIQSNLNLDGINLIKEQDSGQSPVTVNSQSSSVIVPVKTQSFSIIKAPMIQEHSVNNDGDFMKALAHAFGVANRLTFNSPDVQKNFKSAPGIVTTQLPPTIVDQNIQYVHQLPLSQVAVNPSPSSSPPLQIQTLQQALIQSLQRIPAEINSAPSAGQQNPNPGVYKLFSHGNANPAPLKYPVKYQYSVTVADGDDIIGNNNESKTDETSPTVTPNKVVIQEEVKVPLLQVQHEQPQQQQQLYNTEVYSTITQPAVQQQQLQSLPPPQTIAIPNPHPVIRKFYPQSLQEINNNDFGVVVHNSGEGKKVIVKPQEDKVVLPPRKYSDSTAVSKTTFTRFHPKVYQYRNTEETVPQNVQVVENTEAPVQQIQEVQENINVQQESSGEKQVYSPANELSSEAQKQYEEPNQRFVYRYETPQQVNGNVNSNENGQEISEYGPESDEENSQEAVGKYEIFEPQKVVQHQTGPQYLTEFPVQGNQFFRRRRPNGRRLKIRRKKVKTRRLAPVVV